MHALGSTALEGADAADQEYAFTPLTMQRKFGFNAQGARLSLVSLTCRREAPPPLPPYVASSSAQLAVRLEHFQDDARSATKGVDIARQGGTWPSFGALALLLVVALFAILAIRSRAFGSSWASFPNTDMDEHAAAQGAHEGIEMEMAEDEYWSVVFQLGGREVEVPPLPTTCAANLTELKEALAALIYKEFGSQSAPSEWLLGDLDTMRVQYLNAQVYAHPPHCRGCGLLLCV